MRRINHNANRQKVCVFPPKGKEFPTIIPGGNECPPPALGGNNNFQFVAQMDQDYLVIGAHIDEATQDKIGKGLYVNFGKLLPKDRILTDENKLELVIKDGKTFWTPVSETIAINNFQKWEQAFRIFSNIYTRFHPDKAGELIQYNHVIHSISSQYAWENVYAYDKEFRMHIARHPERTWAIILQQAWSMRLRDRISKNESFGQFAGGNSSNNHTPDKSSDYCKRFNKGKCNLGSGCRFEHRCYYCHKFGHGIIVCRKLMFDKEINHPKKKDAVHQRNDKLPGTQMGNGNTHQTSRK